MHSLLRKALLASLLMAGCLWPVLVLLTPANAGQASVGTIRRVDVLSRGSNFELEIDSTQPVKPQTLVVSSPDRLIVDLPVFNSGAQFASPDCQYGRGEGNSRGPLNRTRR